MKKYILFLIVVLFSPIILCACTEKEMNLTSYNIVMAFNNDNKTVTASQNVCFINNYDNAFNELYFHLYPNAFREGAKQKVVSLSCYEKAYKNGFSEGKIEIINVKTDQLDAEYSVCGEDENLLCVKLNREVFPEEQIDVFLEYNVVIPNVEHRFGYGEDTVNLANFYPILCVCESGKGFSKNPYYSNGDPFYSEVANYDVSITYSDDFILSSSGNLQKETTNDGLKTSRIAGQKIRDFAIVLSSKFNKKTLNAGNIKVNYYSYCDESADETLNLCKDVMGFYSDKFGQYPYEQISVVQNDFCYGGMEYPNLVMISDEISGKSLWYVIAHELAHQWWYGVVGNDEYTEAWVDESLTEYSTALFFENNPQYEISYADVVKNATETFKFYYNIYKKVCKTVDTSMARSLDEFGTEPEYVHSIYTQGVLMYDALRSLIGEKKFYKACQNYYSKMAFKNSSGAKLIAIFSNSSGCNLETFFDSYLSGKAMVN